MILSDHAIEKGTSDIEAQLTLSHEQGSDETQEVIANGGDRADTCAATGGTLPLDAQWDIQSKDAGTIPSADLRDHDAWFYTKRKKQLHRVVTTE